MSKFIQIHPIDNVAVAVCDLQKGDLLSVDNRAITLLDPIPAGHKLALYAIPQGANVIKYGYPIGQAITAISAGEHLHTHNLKTNLCDDIDYFYHPVDSLPPIAKGEYTVNGYLRYNGEMGIRNELWIVPTVGCVNGQIQAIVDRVKNEVDSAHIDDIRAFTHNYGCSQLGDDHINTQKALAGLVKHPNCGGVLVLALGCENNQLSDFKKILGEWDSDRVRFLTAQDVEDEIETGVILMKELAEKMKQDKRQPLPLSKLKVGLKCGGSDGFSGITANPLVGWFSDWLIAAGGNTVLTEVPEMFGAETILMDRAADQVVFEKIVQLINGFKNYFRQYNQPIYENPSPGNKTGGITTLEEKSLGCTQKGGTSKVVDVLEYGQPITRNGLNLLNAPGNDLVASSALAISGCQLILFTTGRGTPFGSFVPTLKVSTNSHLFNYKTNWIDFNAGALLEGTNRDELIHDFIDFILQICNGTLLKHEKTGCKEIAIFKSGVTL
ncbi:altronate dehydratase family protein [Parabacteroides sp. PF5-9]|uniref:UxaA family hydrolase n=1 Tax=Parabacteroides sp. PF5-9 TaxID=1742404 RepID=UPI002476AB87|nr:altronate dehydratase family protein [Parabacteroides sp. PF5-9]MDH6356383.1 altronate hydrolase [Parabacteroides sp. PF5-9]